MKKAKHPAAKAAAAKKKAAAAKSHHPVHRRTVGGAATTLAGGVHTGGAAPAKKAHKPRKWTPDGDVSLCSARAVAEAIRLLSGTTLDALELFHAADGCQEAGIPIEAVLKAAQLAVPFVMQSIVVESGLAIVGDERGECAADLAPVMLNVHPLIVGLDLPWGEPHAVTVDLDGTWWSWGEPYAPDDFPGAVIEEAWAVTWC